MRDVVLPYLHELGERWERGEAIVAQEHFASNVLRGRLLGLARGWGRGSGPTTVLACAPGELHDLPLIVFGSCSPVAAGRSPTSARTRPSRRSGRRSAGVEPDLVVISASTTQRLRAAQPELTELARQVPVALAGAGASDGLARRTGATLLDGDPVTAAERVAAEHR